MSRLAIAAPSGLAADAATAVTAAGGNAVDAAVAGAVASMVSEPGVTAPGAGAFVTVWAPASHPVVYDGYMAVPGLGGRNPSPASTSVAMEYGGGMTTLVGPATVAVPGAWAAFGDAHRRHGRVPWSEVLAPAIEMARLGTPLGVTSAHYLEYSHEPVFAHDPVGRLALERTGAPAREGDVVLVDGLADALARIAEHGADDVYRGDIGHSLGTDVRARGGHLSVRDMEHYRVVRRRPLRFRLGSWDLATNPAPAVGGAALVGIVRLAGGRDPQAVVEAQRRVFGWRRSGADLSEDRSLAVLAFLQGLPGDPIRSPSTAHISTASADGTVCAITLSAGYGSGVIPRGTGMWMNNALGELELVGDGSHLRAGDRLNSNMAPTVGASDDGRTLAIGSPGADRITSALAQTLLALDDGLPPADAVSAPRVHVDVGERTRVAIEPGVEVDVDDAEVRRFDRLHMYFGGVGLAMSGAGIDVVAATDPRRNGVTRLV